MRNFFRSLRFAWTYRWRFAASVVCAVLAAGLWAANLAAIYPVMQLLFRPDQTWVVQLDEEINKLQKDYEENLQVLDAHRAELARNAATPASFERERRERQLIGAVAQIEGKLARFSRNIYWRQWAKVFCLRMMPTENFQALLAVFALLVIGVAVRGLFEFGQESLVGSVVNRTLFDLRNVFFRRVIHLDVGQFGEPGTHELMTRFTNDTEALGLGLKTLFGRMISEPLKMFSCIVAACFISWQLTLLFLVLVPLAIVVLTRVGRMMKRASRRLMERMSGIYKILHETFHGIKVVKAFQTEVYERLRFREATRDYYHKAMRVVQLDALTGPIIELLGVAAVSVAVIAGAYLVLEKETHLFSMRMTDHPMDMPTLLQLYGLLAAIADPVRKLSSVYTKLQSGEAASDRIFAAIDKEPTVAVNSFGIPLPRHAEEIEFRDVCFAYDPGRPVLSNVNLTIQHGETIAMVGKNGCGKTTLLGMLPRFFDPDYGSVFVDGIDLREARLRDLRRQIGLVTQDTVLFDDTVHANIAYGMSRATRDQVVEAAKKAFAHDFIEKMPHGYDSRVGDGGAKMSGGQKQRIALARAILRNPGIMILDEFTSQCDPESEALIHQALKTFLKGRTSFVITHRLNTLEIADRIVVMEKGKVVAVGKHAELVETCSVYQRLHEAQYQRKVA